MATHEKADESCPMPRDPANAKGNEKLAELEHAAPREKVLGPASSAEVGQRIVAGNDL